MSNVVMMPYKPREQLNDSLNACDASLVTIAKGIEGISFPSKLYTSLAVGKSIVALSEDWSELRKIVEQSECGIWSGLGDGAGLAEQIRGLIRDPERVEKMGQRARALFDAGYTREVCSAKYAEVLKLADPQFSNEETLQRREQVAALLADGAMISI